MICAFCGSPLDATGSRTCSCRRPADVGVLVAGRRERRARRLHHITEVAAGMRAGLDVREALERADELAHQRERVLAEHERRAVS